MPKVSDIFGPVSVLPVGGGPATDDEFMGWAREFAEEANARLLDRHDPGSLPRHDPLPVWRLINHLLKEFHRGPIDWRHFNHRHRIRALGIRFADRPDRMIASAERYVERLMAEHDC
jgi:hypothetical protein